MSKCKAALAISLHSSLQSNLDQPKGKAMIQRALGISMAFIGVLAAGGEARADADANEGHGDA